MGEQPIFSSRAHVFQIDPSTKKNWLSCSSHSVTVSFFYDSTRHVYRIISLDGAQAVINSTITPNMSFTKTSHKFGQWADSRANTVYGLGFGSETQLNKFAEKFAEFIEAARQVKEKSQERTELTGSPSQRSKAEQTTIKPDPLPVVPRIRSRSSPARPVVESNPHGLQKEPAVDPESINGTEEQETPENKPVPLPHSSEGGGALCSISKHWEAELAALKGNNAKLTSALLESTANVKQWKQQLAAYQEEAERLHRRVTELECVSGQSSSIRSQKTDLNQTIEDLQAQLKAKEEELQKLKEEVQEASALQAQRDLLAQKLQETEQKNEALESQLQDLEKQLQKHKLEEERFHQNLQTVLEALEMKIAELTHIRHTLNSLMDS
ncbi:hypothetical protein DNTS_009423 [Danionella cerebrum]|uniref:WH1 domain-containing protein n=1 Tax=Danionella cerebrum TaxID=2873325 RepID=A0A553NID6_9TELE|nr:hypothetical protein DNTS_009423 [Danionella translucida]